MRKEERGKRKGTNRKSLASGWSFVNIEVFRRVRSTHRYTPCQPTSFQTLPYGVLSAPYGQELRLGVTL
jgi:hypothetical protein